MLLNDVVKRVKDRSHRGDVNVTTDAITAQILRAINDARRDLIRFLPKQFLRKTSSISVVNPTVLYSLAADCQEPLILHYTFNSIEYVMVKIESEREFYQDLYIFTQAINRPFFYVDMGYDASKQRQIQVYPIPDTNGPYTVNYTYFKDPTLVDLDTIDLTTEFPDFPSYMQDALWKGALYYFLKSFDDQGQQIAKGDYDIATNALDIAENQDQDLELSIRFGMSRALYRDPTTGIRLI